MIPEPKLNHLNGQPKIYFVQKNFVMRHGKILKQWLLFFFFLICIA